MKRRLVLMSSRKGSAMIIMAFAMTTALVFGALVLDIGSVMMERQKLQNAVDAACLAAAMELPDTVKAEEKARHYAQANGVDTDDITVTFSDSNNTVDVKANKTVEFFLARIIGFKSTDTAANAAAALDSMGGPFNYAVFSGSTADTLTLSGSHNYITGSSHSNSDFKASGSFLTITGACEAVTTIKASGCNININEQPYSPVVEMPDFSEILKMQAESAGQAYEGNKTFNGGHIYVDSPIYVDGDVTVNGSRFTGNGCILATGSITFNGSNLNASTEDAVCFYSQNGDITINGSHAVLDGILYAPEGSITMNGSHQTINGRVIGDTVAFHGSNLTITSGTNELSSLPSQGVKLVR